MQKLLNPLKNQFQKLQFACKKQILTTSYVHGGISQESLDYSTIGQLLYRQADKYTDNIALISHQQDKQFTYSQLLTDAEKFAGVLRSLGLQRHDRIGIYSPNNYEWTIVQLAASLADLILVNINPAYQAHELEFCLNKVNVKCLVTASNFRKSNYIKMLQEIAPELNNNPDINHLNFKNLKDLKYLIKIDDEKTDGFLNFKELLKSATSKDVDFIRDLNKTIISPDDPTNIQFTSGTTGSPKGATLSHFNILNNGKQVANRMRLTSKDKVCIPVPLYHCFGMVLGNMCAINSGAQMIYPSEVFTATATLESVSKYNATALYGVPTMFIEYFKEYEQNQQIYDTSNLRTGIMAGSICPKVLMEKAISLFNLNELTICYGMTETSPVSFQTSYNDSFEKKTNSVGKVLEHVEAKIIDSQGNPLPIGESGELVVRGYVNMKGYFNDEQKTKQTIDENGWLHSGDIAKLDQDGYLQITGRIKDMIIRGGENVYPKEIEDYLQSFKEIIEDAQIVGVPDDKYGEEIFACIKLKEGVKDFDPNEIFKMCKGQIAHYKIPKYVKIYENYPLTVTGKIMKYKIRDEIQEESQNNQQNLQKYSIRNY